MHELEMLDYICKIVPDVGLVKAYIVEYLPTITRWYNDPAKWDFVEGNCFEDYVYNYISEQMRIIWPKYEINDVNFQCNYRGMIIAEPSRLNTLIHAYHFSPEHLLWLIGVCSKYEAYEQVAILEQRIAEIGGCKSLTDRFQI